jgi:hypothetical protein
MFAGVSRGLRLLVLLALPAGAEERVEGQFLPEEFFQSVEKVVPAAPDKATAQVTFAKRAVTFLFEPWEIAQPRFRHGFKAPYTPQTLFFKTVGYDPKEQRLEVPCTVFEARESQGGRHRAMPLFLKLKMEESDGWKAIQQFKRRELRIELAASIDGVQLEYRGPRRVFLLHFLASKARLLCLKTPWLEPAVEVSHDESISPGALQEKEDVGKEFAEPTPKTRLMLKVADFASLKLFADWHPEQKGWYARDFLDTYGHDHKMAVMHRGREGAEMWTSLPQSLPPGDWQVFVQPGYTRQRVREHIVKVTLNDQTHEFRWQLTRGLDSGGWIPAPVFSTRKAGRLLKIEGIQVGGGGLGGVPEPPSWAILLDSAFITDDLEMRTPAELSKDEEKEE